MRRFKKVEISVARAFTARGGADGEGVRMLLSLNRFVWAATSNFVVYWRSHCIVVAGAQYTQPQVHTDAGLEVSRCSLSEYSSGVVVALGLWALSCCVGCR